MSDTPETDVSCGYALSSHYGRLEGSYLQMDRNGPFVHAEVARKLEQSRDEWAAMCGRYKQERDEARESLKHITEYGTEEINAAVELRQKLASALVERDEALMDRANGDIATMTINHYERILQERDEVREAFKIVYNERVQMELERNEWKNKAYSHATDYTLMEAKCFRLEQQLKEYDKLKS